MPRSRGSAPGASRPAAVQSRPTAQPPQRSVAPQQQQRPMSTAPAQQPQQQAAPVQSSGGSGLFGQMASTAAGVAVGSSIGHAIGGFFGGGSSSPAAPAAEQQPQQAMDNALYSANVNPAQVQQAQQTGPCATDIRNFTQCMQQQNGDLNICGWYLEQLKACQAAAANY